MIDKLKKHWLIIVCGVAVVVCVGMFTYRCTMPAVKNGPSLIVDGQPVASTDWTMIGSAVGAILASLIAGYQAWRNKNTKGLADAIDDIREDVNTIRDAVKGNVAIEPSATRLAQSIAVLQGEALPNESQLKLAKDLLEKFSITLRP